MSDPCRAADGYNIQMIEDFETDHSQNQDAYYVNCLPANADVNCYNKPRPVVIPGGRCGVSTHALQAQFSGLLPGKDAPPDAGPDGGPPDTGGWGAQIQAEWYRVGPKDARGWDGISFWIRRGTDAPGNTTFVMLPEKNTIAIGGICQDNAGGPKPQCDPFGMGVGFDTEWQFFALPFAKMRQRGYGGGVDPQIFFTSGVAALWAMKFDLSPAATWDVWLDDVAFYKAPPSADQ